jgi:hypothetical protein
MSLSLLSLCVLMAQVLRAQVLRAQVLRAQVLRPAELCTDPPTNQPTNQPTDNTNQTNQTKCTDPPTNQPTNQQTRPTKPTKPNRGTSLDRPQHSQPRVLSRTESLDTVCGFRRPGWKCLPLSASRPLELLVPSGPAVYFSRTSISLLIGNSKSDKLKKKISML